VSALRWLRALLLRWQIWETEHWLRDCARDGLLEGRALSDIRAQLAGMRVNLALLQASTVPCTRPKRATAVNATKGA